MSNSFISDIKNELDQSIKGEVRFREVDKILYSSDASNYQIKPLGVVIPKTLEDLLNTINIAKKSNVPVIPRGGGTGLAGQAVGSGIVVDFSKYFNKIKFVDLEKNTVLVQPGLNLESLNNYLTQYGLMFGPDPSSARVATIGGVISNNATGAHSILYGMSGDHVKSASVVTSDSSKLLLSEDSSRENVFYERLDDFVSNNKSLVSKLFPKHWRRASGYSLNYLLDKKFNPAKLLASSEGTLAMATELELNLVSRPKFKGLCLLQFQDLIKSLEFVPEILEKNPSAIELMDGLILELTRGNKSFSKPLSLFKDSTKAVLIIEFYGNSQKEVQKKLAEFSNYIKAKKITKDLDVLIDPEHQESIWNLRKAGLGLLMSKRSDFKPIPCIEDVSVPVDKLSKYTGDLTSIMDEMGLSAGYYGHASAGCLHIRPLVNLSNKKGVAQMSELLDASLKLAQKYSGVLSGEHGDGIQRSSFNRVLFGDEIYDVMKELKNLFDPINLFNPNKVVDGFAPKENLRLQKNNKIKIPTILDWSSENGIAKAAEMCNGQGVCRKLHEGVMCPSFKATKDENDSTRARANSFRSFFNGEINKQQLFSEEFYDVFDLCIGCKACKTECPSSVDVSKMKTEYLGQYKKDKGFSLKDRIFSNINTVSRFNSYFSNTSNFLQNSPLLKELLSLVGIDKRRSLPRLANRTFSNWFNKFGNDTDRKYKNKAVYFHDTWVEFYYPEIGKAVVKLLNSIDYEVILENKRTCCGRPMISSGMLDKAKQNALRNITFLSKYSDEGIPIIFSEPSCFSAFKDDYFDIIPESSKLTDLSNNIYLLGEFLFERIGGFEKIVASDESRRVFIHGHCHQRSLNHFENSLELLERLGFEVENSNAGCCGMAGSFGYEKDHYEISKLIGEDRLFPKIREITNENQVCVTGVSCLEQIKHFTNSKPVHIAELLLKKLVDN